MKKLSYILLGVLCALSNPAKSQVIMDTNAVSTLTETITEEFTVTRYYFYPNLDAYYDRKISKFIYKVNGEWIQKETIPNNYRGYSLFNNYKVELNDYLGDEPFVHIKEHLKLYPKNYKGRHLKNKSKAITENKFDIN
jgi:hypothetical protein